MQHLKQSGPKWLSLNVNPQILQRLDDGNIKKTTTELGQTYKKSCKNYWKLDFDLWDAI